jgi:hypothetical protein
MYSFFKGYIKSNLGWSVVSADDIVYTEKVRYSSEEIIKKKFIPYCFDYNRGVLILTSDLDPHEAANEAFQYVFLRNNAREFCELPLKNFQLIDSIDSKRVFFLLSPGRCGSTLLSKLIQSMNVQSISEPDFYSQAAFFFANNKLSKQQIYDALDLLRIANHILLLPFLRQSNSKVLIKTRSHVTASPEILISGFKNSPNFIFLTRNFISWCESRMRAFRNTLNDNLKIYIRTEKCREILEKNTSSICISYEEFLTHPLESGHKISNFFNTELDPVTYSVLLGKDSQESTELSRKKIQKVLSESEKLAIKDVWFSYIKNNRNF